MGGGWWGGVIPLFPPPRYPAVLPVYPPPRDVPGCTAASAHAAAPRGGPSDVGTAGREGGGAPEGMREGRRGREDGAEEGGTGDGCGSRGGRGAGKHPGHPGGGERLRPSRSCSAPGRTFGEERRGLSGQSGTASGKGNGRIGARRQRATPAEAHLAARYRAGGGAGGAGAGLREDQGRGSEAGGEGQEVGGAGMQVEGGGGGGSPQGATGHPRP